VLVLLQEGRIARATFTPLWYGVVRDSFLSSLEKVKKIYDYERRIVFKYDIVVGFTLSLFLDGNRAIGSFFHYIMLLLAMHFC
jgi:hypothetical protein